MTRDDTNSYREKGRAVFLAAIMVLSVVAMATAFSGAAAANVTDGELDFNDQAFNDEGEVLVEGVEYTEGEGGGTVLVTYEDGDNVIVAGLTDENDLDDENVLVDIEDPEELATDEFTAHIVPDSEVDGVVAGHNISEDLDEGNVDPVADDTATVYDADTELTFEEQGYAESTDTLNVDTAEVLGEYADEEDLLFTVDVHPTDGDGELIDDEFVGSSDVLEGDESDVTVDLTEEITETDDYVAMLHIVPAANASDVSAGNEAEPGEFPALFQEQGDDELEAIVDDAEVDIAEDVQDVAIVRGGVEDRAGSSLNDIEVQLVNEVTGQTEDTFTTEEIDGDDGEYILEVAPNEATNYNLVVDDDDFDTFTRTIEGLERGERVDQSITLDRRDATDRLTVLDDVADIRDQIEEIRDGDGFVDDESELDPASVDEETVDAGETATLDVLAESEVFGDDEETLEPYADQTDEIELEEELTDDDVSGADASDIEVSVPASTDEDGIAEVDVELDESVDVDELTDNIEVDLTIGAASNGEYEAQEVTVVFQVEVRGTGTISGEVDEYMGDNELGVESFDNPNVEPADTRVYAVPEEDFADNEVTIDGFEDEDEGDAYRIVSVDEETGTTSVEDARLDYLVSTDDEIEVVQNESSVGFNIDEVDADEGAEITLRFLDNGSYQLEQYNELEGEFETVEDDGFDTTLEIEDEDNVDNTFKADESLTASDIEAEFEDDPATPVDVTNDNGGFELYNLPTSPDGEEYVVIAGGIAATDDDQTAHGFANFAGHTTVTVSPNAAGDADQLNTDLTVQEIEIEQFFDYDLEVFASDEFVSEDRIQTGEETQVTVAVEATNQDTDEVTDPDSVAVQGQEIDLELLDDATEQERIDEGGVADFGVLDQTTIEVDDVVEIDDEEIAVATTTFEADDVEAGEANVSASTENDNNQIYATVDNDDDAVGINDRGDQAQIDVFTTIEITGDIVNEDDANIPGAQVELLARNESTGNFEDLVDTTFSGTSGSYVFSGVETGQELAVNATALDEDGNIVSNLRTLEGGRAVEDPLGGEDIVVEGAVEDQPLEPADFSVSDLNPEAATIQQGDDLTVSATIENAGGLEDTQDVVLQIEDEDGTVTELDSEELELDADQSAGVEFTVENVDLDAGDYTHSIATDNDDASGTLTVEADDDESDDDELVEAPGGVDIPEQYTTTDEDGNVVVETTGLLDAGTDFQNGDIGTGTLLDIGTAFQNS